jgi:hypothetical protein
MGEAFWNEEGSVIGGTQDFGVPEQKGCRTLAQIHCDIEHLSTQAADELGLLIGRALKVHTAYRAAPGGEGVINLDDMFAGNE